MCGNSLVVELFIYYITISFLMKRVGGGGAGLEPTPNIINKLQNTTAKILETTVPPNP